MSRVGKQPIALPKGVKAEISGQRVKVEGPKGKAERTIRPEIKIGIEDGKIVLSRVSEAKEVRAYHGMERALVNNLVVGVSQGFVRELDIIGVGYRADMKGANVINFALGHSHQIDFPLPAGVTGAVVKEGRETTVRLEGVDRQAVGQTAARIRALRPPEIYKGKGVRYKGEVVKTKAGKTGKK
jgi:large subunit ribosomal protein L6